jgi:hypothetical protein
VLFELAGIAQPWRRAAEGAKERLSTCAGHGAPELLVLDHGQYP